MGKSSTEMLILLIGIIIFGIVAVSLLLGSVFGQTQENVTVTVPSPAATVQKAVQVAQELPTIANQVDTNTALTTTMVPIIGAVGTYIAGKTLKDRKDKSKIEEYASATDKIIFNHVMDNYNDFANYCKTRRAMLTAKYIPGNENLTEKQLLDLVIDPVTGETYAMREIKMLDNIINWNIQYYGSPSNDPNITCPDPKNKIARTMTDIKKLSVPNTIETSGTASIKT